MRKISIALVLLVIMSIFAFSFASQINPDESIDSINSTISQLNQEEVRILESLFLIKQEIRELEINELKTSQEIESLSLSIQNLQNRITAMEESYMDNLGIMEEVLRSYQRKGPLSNLQLILSSENLSTLLRRINSIRDLSRNTNELLLTIEAGKQELAIEKLNLDNSLLEIQNRRAELLITIAEKSSTIRHLEESLRALQDEKGKYESYLSDIDDSWEATKPIFLQTIQGITTTVENGELPESILNVQISFTGIRGKILDSDLNEELDKKGYPTPPQLLFFMDRVQLIMSGLNLEINGNLVILDEKTLRFEITDGKYLGLALEKSAVMDLFDFGYLDLKFHKLLGNNTIRSIELHDGYMDLQIRPSIF